MGTPTRPLRLAPDFSAAARAGLIAGVVFLAIEMIAVPVFLGGSPWVSLHMISAIVLGRDVLPPATFDIGVILVALIVHFALSVSYALVLGLLVAQMHAPGAVLTGAMFGAVLYLINFFWFTAAFPWFATARNQVTVVSHLLFGMVAGATYVALRRLVVVAARGYTGLERRYPRPGQLWTGPERRRA